MLCIHCHSQIYKFEENGFYPLGILRLRIFVPKKENTSFITCVEKRSKQIFFSFESTVDYSCYVCSAKTFRIASFQIKVIRLHCNQFDRILRRYESYSHTSTFPISDNSFRTKCVKFTATIWTSNHTLLRVFLSLFPQMQTQHSSASLKKKTIIIISC